MLHYHTYLRWVVVQSKLVQYDYFMDKMQKYELYSLADEVKYSHKEEWEMTRKVMYATISPWLKDKNTTEEDICPLATDEKYIEYYKSEKPTDYEINRIQEMIEATRKQLMGQS